MDFSFFFSLFGAALAFFYSVRPSYGLAIIALTLAVMIVLTPLTLKGTRSMMMMQQLQPEMKKLQSRYKDDRQKLNEELLKFYKENNINPVGGCLPLLVQMPVFLVLYNVLRGLTQRVPSTGSSVGWVSGQFGSGTGLSKPPVIKNPFDPEYIPHDSAMYNNLSHSNTMAFAGMDLSQSCQEALSQGVVHALPYIALIAVVGVSGFVQQRQIQGRTPSSQINPQQQQIMKIMPIFLPVISFGLPAGLVLYFAVSNLYRIGQQWFISRSIYGIKRGDKPESGDDDGPKKATNGPKKPPNPKSAGPKSGGSKGAGSTGGASGSRSRSAGDGDRSVGSGEVDSAKGSKKQAGEPAVAATTTRDRVANARKAAAEARDGAGKSTGSNGNSRASKGTKADNRNDTSGTKRVPNTKTPPAPGRDAAAAPPTLQPRARKKKR